MAPKRGKILVIEDDVGIGRMLVRLLRNDHELLVATDGLDALALLEAGQRFDAILCDINMPNLSGAGVRRSLMRFAPDQVDRLIFLTANPASSLAGQLQSHVVLDKAEDIPRLRELVARVVEAAQSGYFPSP
jgi:CheY-like chemotaxis protein